MHTQRVFVLAGIIAFVMPSPRASAQGYGYPLTIQGINNLVIQSAASRSAGGLTAAYRNDVSLMFVNPASLHKFEGIHFAIGALQNFSRVGQTQQWLPLRKLPTFSLLMEGLLDSIPDPDLSNPPPEGLGPEDSIPRAFDSIKPNWSKTRQNFLPANIFAAMPLELAGIRVVAGLGVVEYVNLGHYFQNNNVLSPSIGSQRPAGVPLPLSGEEVIVQWSRFLQSREGSIYGYGGVVSLALTELWSVGVGGLLLSGSSDDYEMTAARGRFRFGNNDGIAFFVLDSTHSLVSRAGTSDYSGMEFTASTMIRTENLVLSIAVKSPTKISRRYESETATDTGGVVTTVLTTGRDRIEFPWRGSLGLSFAVRKDLTVGLEYEVRRFASAEYKSPQGTLSSPWRSGSVFRVGAEFLAADWLALRGGFREEAEVFEPEGNALVGDPVRFGVYSIGCGIAYSNVRLDLGYEYTLLEYADRWQTNVNINTVRHQNVFGMISYVLR